MAQHALGMNQALGFLPSGFSTAVVAQGGCGKLRGLTGTTGCGRVARMARRMATTREAALQCSNDPGHGMAASSHARWPRLRRLVARFGVTPYYAPYWGVGSASTRVGWRSSSLVHCEEVTP